MLPQRRDHRPANKITPASHTANAALGHHGVVAVVDGVGRIGAGEKDVLICSTVIAGTPSGVRTGGSTRVPSVTNSENGIRNLIDAASHNPWRVLAGLLLRSHAARATNAANREDCQR